MKKKVHSKMLPATFHRILLVSSILLAVIIITGGLLLIQINKQQSIEKQQQLDLQAKKAEDATKKRQADDKAAQDKLEYTAKRKKDCYDIEQQERKNFNNVLSSSYDSFFDSCHVTYSTHEYDGVDCDKVYPPNYITSGQNAQCKSGTFVKTF